MCEPNEMFTAENPVRFPDGLLGRRFHRWPQMGRKDLRNPGHNLLGGSSSRSRAWTSTARQTGQIRSNSSDDIACWFIDTNYNGESFFVRHAYFTGGNEPYDKLKRALRAEIDEAAWSALYSTVSRPFDKPDTGKLAVKVINHYGDEVLKVYGV